MLPREKLVKLGPQSLTPQELLAILIGTGDKQMSVFELSEKVYSKLVTLINPRDSLTIKSVLILQKSLRQFKALGEVKISRIVSAFELARRYTNGQFGTRVKTISDLLALMHFLKNRKKEYVYGIYVDTHLYLLKTQLLFKGGVDFAQIGMREVFAPIFTSGASAFFIVHNHPSGNFMPSKEDRRVTEQIKSIANALDVRFLDHVIISKRGYFSFKESML